MAVKVIGRFPRLGWAGPTLTAWELHRAWPGSELIVVEEEGHGGPIMAEYWREAMERLVDGARRARPVVS